MSRARQHAEFERLAGVLTGAPYPAWTALLQARADGKTLATDLLRAYRHGALIPERWTALTGQPSPDLAEIHAAVRQLWDEFVAAGLVKPYSAGSWSQTVTPGVIHRWAWQPRWYLTEQDEDLLLMEWDLIPALLAAAADPRAPKRDYIHGIVAHHARDQLYQAVHDDKDVPTCLRRAAAFAPQARTNGAAELARYLERLGAHADEAPVDRDGAEQRLLDMGRCSEPPRDKLDIQSIQGGFEGNLITSGSKQRVRIAAATGRITLVPNKPRKR